MDSSRFSNSYLNLDAIMKNLYNKIYKEYLNILNLFNDLILAIVTIMPGATGIRLRHRYYTLQGAKLAKNVRLYEGVVIKGAANCIIEDGSILYAGTTLAIGSSGFFRMGKYSHFGARCYVLVGDGNIGVGNQTAIGPHTLLLAHSNSVNGDYPIVETVYSGTITIDDDVFIGAGVIVLPNVSIPSHCVVGAGAVVIRDLEEWSISVGCPAQVIKNRLSR